MSGNSHFNAAWTLAIAAWHKHHDHAHGTPVLSRGGGLGKLTALLGSHLFADRRTISGGSDNEIDFCGAVIGKAPASTGSKPILTARSAKTLSAEFCFIMPPYIAPHS